MGQVWPKIAMTNDMFHRKWRVMQSFHLSLAINPTIFIFFFFWGKEKKKTKKNLVVKYIVYLWVVIGGRLSTIERCNHGNQVSHSSPFRTCRQLGPVVCRVGKRRWWTAPLRARSTSSPSVLLCGRTRWLIFFLSGERCSSIQDRTQTTTSTCNHRMEKPRSAFWVALNHLPLIGDPTDVDVHLSCPFSQADWWCCHHAYAAWLASFPAEAGRGFSISPSFFAGWFKSAEGRRRRRSWRLVISWIGGRNIRSWHISRFQVDEPKRVFFFPFFLRETLDSFSLEEEGEGGLRVTGLARWEPDRRGRVL